MIDVILESLINEKSPIDAVSLPYNIGNGYVNKREDGKYQIINTIQPFTESGTGKEVLLIAADKSTYKIKLDSPKFDNSDNKAFDFNSDKDLPSGNYKVYAVKTIDLYDVDDWSAIDRIRFARAQSAATKLAYSSRPINQIVSVLEIVDKYTEIWASLLDSDTSAEFFNTNGGQFTPEDVRKNYTDWKFILDYLTPVAEYALNNDLVSPISAAQYSVEMRSIHCTMISASLGINGDILDDMSGKQVAAIWSAIEERLEQQIKNKTDKIDDDDEVNKSDKADKKKSSRGKKSTAESVESPNSLPESQPTIEPPSAIPQSIP
jgi:hypothetical protein